MEPKIRPDGVKIPVPEGGTVSSVTELPGVGRHFQGMTTLMLIILLAWFPLSLPLAVLVGKCIKLGSSEPEARVAMRQHRVRMGQQIRRPADRQRFFRAGA